MKTFTKGVHSPIFDAFSVQKRYNSYHVLTAQMDPYDNALRRTAKRQVASPDHDNLEEMMVDSASNVTGVLDSYATTRDDCFTPITLPQ